ncbi:Smr/MutS family protein [Hyphobacterium sp.]|uniref:Smr/MutS family protein n=1 Tax=Hyphobacterium sp. TaxID=2004662 RepID=UPI00374A356B
MTSRSLKPEERQIWRKVTRSVTPLHVSRDEMEAELSASPKPSATTGLGQTRPATKPKPVIPVAKPPPADRSAERRLRRGRVEIDARIDLHGMTQTAARTSLGHFLHAARSRGFRAVLVITGKGKAGARNREPGEEAPGVIRRRFPEWLAEPELRHLVSGYASAHRRHGGEGAFYVMIRTG